MSLSVVIITKPEEKYLAEVLSSASFADEVILVVDSPVALDKDSFIKTEKAKVFFRKLDTHANQKNFGIERSSGEWVLSIDADEVLSSGLVTEISEVIKKPDFEAYFLPFKNFIGKKWLRFGGLYPDYHLRLFKKGVGNFKGSIHESIKLKKAGYLKNPVLHYTYENLNHYLSKVRFYAVKEGKAEIIEGKRVSVVDYLQIVPRFIKLFFFKLGFLDGFYGLASSFLLSYYTILKISYMRKNQKQ